MTDLLLPTVDPATGKLDPNVIPFTPGEGGGASPVLVPLGSWFFPGAINASAVHAAAIHLPPAAAWPTGARKLVGITAALQTGAIVASGGTAPPTTVALLDGYASALSMPLSQVVGNAASFPSTPISLEPRAMISVGITVGTGSNVTSFGQNLTVTAWCL